MSIRLKQLAFFWITSFVLAVAVYYLLWLIMPHHYVFGALFRMFCYHMDHPLPFIAIPCFFYGIIASLFSTKISQQGFIMQILTTILIIILTVLISSPFGGMLWHYYDMKAGYFPENWFLKMVRLGFEWGLEIGWYIIALSIPYTIIGSIVCFYLTRKGSLLFHERRL
jgi:hypothetical protein